MGKKKIVLDTNIFISAFGWGGNPNKIFEESLTDNLIIITSYEQFEELCRVLEYPRLGFTPEQKSRIKRIIQGVAVFVSPLEKLQVVKEDPADNKIIEAAIAGKADYILTGDKHLLKLKEFRGIKIVSPEEFCKTFKI